MRLWPGILVFAVALGAQSPAVKSVIGEITAIDAAAKQFKVKGDDGTAYTVTTDESTALLRVPPGEKDLKKATKVGFSDVAVGDRLLTRGVVAEDTKAVPAKTAYIMTKGDLAQKHARDRAEWQRRGAAGVVTAINADTKEITITARARETKTIIIDASAAGFQRYASDSIRFADAKPGSFAELRTGDTVRALGDKNEEGTRLKAEEIVSGAFQTIAATVISVDAATGEVRLTDLQTKKPVTVHTNQNSMLRKLEERTAMTVARFMRPDAATAPSGRGSESETTAASDAGRGGRGGRGNFDLQQILERSPQLALADLKKGDAVIVSSVKTVDGAPITAISLVAGVEPVLAAAPRTAGQVNLGSWNLEAGTPEQ